MQAKDKQTSVSKDEGAVGRGTSDFSLDDLLGLGPESCETPNAAPTFSDPFQVTPKSSTPKHSKSFMQLVTGPLAKGNSVAASANAMAVLAECDAAMCLQPSPVRSGSQGPAAHTSEAPPAFEAAFPEHHQDSRPAPQAASQPAAQPAPQQPKLGSNNPFGASSFGAKAFPGPSRQTGQAPARVSSSGAGYPVPATPAPSLATGASADANVFPSQPAIAGVLALPSYFAAWPCGRYILSHCACHRVRPAFLRGCNEPSVAPSMNLHVGLPFWMSSAISASRIYLTSYSVGGRITSGETSFSTYLKIMTY